ncbi:MAG: hypothetical protein EHM41_00220 [Chloroflexi bacterium]|nr:MAG: hypothetical protein EHM41_00220 [Chloroflexota bacterium]
MILIDDRKGSRELAPLIKSPTQLTRLEYGDFAFIGNGVSGQVSVGIERKTIPDLVASITSGRLSGHQLLGLTASYEFVYLLVEGMWRQGPDGVLEILQGRNWIEFNLGSNRFTAREINNYLNTLRIICNVAVWQTPNIRQSARWISDSYNWWQKDYDKHRAHLAFHETAPQNNKVVLIAPNLIHRIAKELPDVGWEKGKLIAEKYKTVVELACATEEELMEIPGIGKKIAKHIIQALRGAEE